jgi:hypothetical protein
LSIDISTPATGPNPDILREAPRIVGSELDAFYVTLRAPLVGALWTKFHHCGGAILSTIISAIVTGPNPDIRRFRFWRLIFSFMRSLHISNKYDVSFYIRKRVLRDVVGFAPSLMHFTTENTPSLMISMLIQAILRPILIGLDKIGRQ